MIITLCGSTRFKDDFLEWNKAFTRGGSIVLMPGVFGHAGDEITPQEKENLDRLHKQKIAMSNMIFVIDKDGYVGESTRKEIQFAKEIGVPVVFASGMKKKQENDEPRETNSKEKVPLVYLGGDIMTFGSNLAREYEYKAFLDRELPVNVYSPVQNKSINDKSNMTEEENNVLAEKITEADIERLWNSDIVVMSPEQSAIGSMCETGCLFGWKYLTDRLLEQIKRDEARGKSVLGIYENLIEEIKRINQKENYFHYFDIRTNHLNEKDWRRSFSINQLLYGMILYAAKNGDFETFEEILDHLSEDYKKEEN